MSSRTNELRLKVYESYVYDIGLGIARIDSDTMDKLGVSRGDVIEVIGKSRTVAKCLQLYRADAGKGKIKFDGLIRHNAGVTITSGRGSESVTVRKIKAVPAGKVILAPLENVPPFNDHFLSNVLANIAIVKGDTVIVPHFDGRLSFQVIDILPSIDQRDGYTVRPVVDTDAFLVNFHSEFEICPLNPDHGTKVEIRNLKPWNVEELK